jgi:hypothetical protein
MKAEIKKELIVWGIFILLILIVIIPLSLGMTYIGIPKGWQSAISFVLGMVLMFVSRLIVDKRYND